MRLSLSKKAKLSHYRPGQALRVHSISKRFSRERMKFRPVLVGRRIFLPLLCVLLFREAVVNPVLIYHFLSPRALKVVKTRASVLESIRKPWMKKQLLLHWLKTLLWLRSWTVVCERHGSSISSTPRVISGLRPTVEDICAVLGILRSIEY
jgi:hypothetical protein